MREVGVFAALFFGMAVFGSGTPTAKVVTDGFPIFLAPFLRLLLAALLTTPLLIVYRRELRGISRRGWLLIGGIGAIGLVAFSLFLLSGMTLVSGVIGAVVMSTSPAAVALGAAWFLGEELGSAKIAAVGLSIAGVVIINTSGAELGSQGVWGSVLGSLLVFGAVASATAYSLFAKRVTGEVRPVLLIPLAAWTAAALFAGPGLYQAAQFDFAAPSTEQWIALAWWGVGPFGIGTMLWFYGLKSVQASTASGFMGAMPASGLLVSYVWLGEAFHWVHLVGFALVLAAIALVAWAHRRGEAAAAAKGRPFQGCTAYPC
ncbi:MAG: DMT family transporter [Acetobacterales bacterium]